MQPHDQTSAQVSAAQAIAPRTDRRRVRPRAQQHVRRAVPQRHDLVREGVDGDAEGACETKVGELELVALGDEQVLRLEVAMQDAILVAEGGALEELEHEAADDVRVERAAVAV